MNKFGFKQFLIRFTFALILVLATYNPTHYSFVHWVLYTFPDITPYVGLAGITLIIGWVIYIRATILSLGKLGITLAATFFGCFIWLFVYLGLLELKSASIFSWLILFMLSILLGLGMSWSHIRRNLSGQVDTDRVDD